MGRRRVVICTLIFIALSQRNIHFLSLFSLERQQRQWDNIIYECYFSLRAVLIHMEKSICFFKVTFCIFFHCYFFYFSPLRFAFIALPLLPSMLLLYFFKLSYTSSFLISIHFFLLKAILTRKTQQRWSRVLYSSSFFFFFFSLSLLIHRRRRMCNLELLHFSRVIWAPLRLLRVVVLRKKQAISNFFCCMMSSSPKTLLFLGANLIVKNESFLRIIIMRRNFPKYRNFMEYVYTRLRNVKKFQGIINFSL